MLGLRPKPHTSFKKRSKRGETPLKGGLTPSFFKFRIKVNRRVRARPRARVPAGTFFATARVPLARGDFRLKRYIK